MGRNQSFSIQASTQKIEVCSMWSAICPTKRSDWLKYRKIWSWQSYVNAWRDEPMRSEYLIETSLRGHKHDRTLHRMELKLVVYQRILSSPGSCAKIRQKCPFYHQRPDTRQTWLIYLIGFPIYAREERRVSIKRQRGVGLFQHPATIM